MTAFTSGRYAEAVAADYLRSIGFKILERNWRTRYCEIDLVAQRDKQVWFFEVKYRKRSLYGTGLDAITYTKLQRMAQGARFWVSNNNWMASYELAAIEVSGPYFKITCVVRC